MGELSSWKISSLIGNNIWTLGCTWLPKMSTYSLAVMRPFRVIILSAEYWCCPNHRSAYMFHSLNQAFRNIGFLGNSAGINPAWCWEQCEGQLIWPYYIFLVIRCPGFMIITPSFLPSNIVFSNQYFSKSNTTVDVGSVKISDSFCGNRVFKMNIEFFSHLCCSSSMIFRHNPLHCMVIPFI